MVTVNIRVLLALFMIRGVYGALPKEGWMRDTRAIMFLACFAMWLILAVRTLMCFGGDPRSFDVLRIAVRPYPTF